MSVEEYGKNLLAEADETPFGQFLQALQVAHKPIERQRLSIPALDRLLNVFTCPSNNNDTAQGHLQRPPNISQPPVLEITALEPCSGRTQLLHYITAHSVLPKSLDNVALPGKQGTTIYIDTDNQFSTLRLHDILSQTITSHINRLQSGISLDVEDVRSTILSSLEHVHVFYPASSQALVAILENLPEYLLNIDAHNSSARALTTIIISNIGAFVWSDRQIPPTRSSTEPSPTVLHQRFAQLTATLRNTQKQFPCTIVAGAWAFASPKAASYGGKELRPFLPPSWNDFCAVRVVVQRDKVRKFGPGLSVEEATAEGAKRWEAVQKVGWTGWLNWWGWEGWDRRMLERAREVSHGGGFEMNIDDTGIQLLESGASGDPSSNFSHSLTSDHLC